MRIQIDGVTYLRPEDAVPILMDAPPRELVISGVGPGREVLAAAALVIHCVTRDGIAKVENPARVAAVAEQIAKMIAIEANLASGEWDPSDLEPDPHLEAAVRTVALYGWEFPRLLLALAPRDVPALMN